MTGQVKVSQPTVTGTLTISSGTISGQASASVSNVVRPGTGDYDKLDNKPALQYGQIKKELVGTVSMADFGLREEALQSITNEDIDTMIRRLF